MTELDFSALLVSRVCHDLVGPLGAVVNGLEVLEEERDAALRADALKLVTSSAEQALARLQFMRLAFGAAGSAGSELTLSEVQRLSEGLFDGGRIKLDWQASAQYWPKDWAKLVMNAVVIAADCLPRGGVLHVETATGPAPAFSIMASGTGARVAAETARIVAGGGLDNSYEARGIQSALTVKLALVLGVRLVLTPSAEQVEIRTV